MPPHTPTPEAVALTAAAARRAGRIIEDRTTLPVPGWRWVPLPECVEIMETERGEIFLRKYLGG